MSKINTGPIDTNYPVTGVVNTTQQFGENWRSIVHNLDVAGTEITELQSKVLLKGPLPNVTINNNMDGTLISNALINNFRHTTKNLGNNISGNLVIDVTDADVQYAGISNSINLQFVNWPRPTSNQTSVQSNCQLIFNRVNNVSPLNIYFPTTVNQGTITLENYNGNGTGGFVTMATDVSQLHFNFTTVNQGSNIEIQPMDRPRIPEVAPNGEVTSVGLRTNDVGFSVTGSPVTSNGVITIKNTGVTSIAAGANIIISGSTGDVIINSLANISRIPLGIPSPGGSPGDALGQVFADNNYLYVCTANYDGGNPIWKRATLQLSPVSTANFSANILAGPPPLTVAFTDTSINSPTSWAWDFENNGTVDSTNQNPVYTYTTTGIYSVKLTSTNSAGSNSVTKNSYILVGNPPSANFTTNVVTGPAPLTVEFIDTSTNSPSSWQWDFGNTGTVDSTYQNPIYTFTTPGTYSVKLISDNSFGSNTVIKTNLINVTTVPAPVPPPPPPPPPGPPAPPPPPPPPPPPFNTSGWTVSWQPSPVYAGESTSNVDWSINNAPSPATNSVQIVVRQGSSTGNTIASYSPYGLTGPFIVGSFPSSYIGNLYLGIQLWTSSSNIGQSGQLIAEKGIINQLVAAPPAPPTIGSPTLYDPTYSTLAYGERSGPSTYRLASVFKTSPAAGDVMAGKTYAFTRFEIGGQTVDVVGYPVAIAGQYYHDMINANVDLPYNVILNVRAKFVATDGSESDTWSNTGTMVRYSY